jgi:hypothetical protein
MRALAVVKAKVSLQGVLVTVCPVPSNTSFFSVDCATESSRSNEITLSVKREMKDDWA